MKLLEVLVFQGRVREIRESGEPFDIPEETGYVIVTNGENKEKITDMLEIGTRVELEYNFDINDMNWGIGTVNYLLKEGNLYKTNSMVSGRQPRSAVAVNEDRDEMYFIAVDGRSANSVGFTQEDLADFIIEIGGYEAVNLDGGGSTTLASERYDSVVVLNKPSDGRERGIVSGLGVFSNYDKKDKDVEFIKSKLEDRYYFPNQKFNVNVTGYNEDRIPVEIDKETLKVSSDLNHLY